MHIQILLFIVYNNKYVYVAGDGGEMKTRYKRSKMILRATGPCCVFPRCTWRQYITMQQLLIFYRVEVTTRQYTAARSSNSEYDKLPYIDTRCAHRVK